MSKKFKTNIGELTFIEKNIVFLKLDDKLNIKIDDGIIYRNFFKEIIKNEVGMIVEVRGIQATASPKSMRFFTTDPTFNNLCKFQAIIVNSTSTKLLANFYVNYLKKKSNARVFNNYEDALIWIEDKVKTFSLAN